MDFRLGRAIKEYLEKNGLMNNCDIVSLGGAAKNVAAPASEANFITVMKQIERAQKLHAINTVILMNHTDCGAYGGRAVFTSREEERAKHREDMTKAAEVIKQLYPELGIQTVLADIQDSGEINFV